MTQIEYVLVPKEPTEAMREALTHYWIMGGENHTEIDAYRAMIAAAPPVEALPPTGDVAKLVEELKYQIAPYSVGDLFDRTADALTAATARIAELERELKARKNYTDEDYIRLHNAHCFTAIKLATATAHAETLEAALREAQEAWSRYEKFLDLTGTATDIERAYNDLCAALQPPEAP